MTTGQALDVGAQLSRAQRRRLFLRALLRCLLIVVALVAIYAVVPLQDLAGHPVWVPLSAGLVLLVVVILLQVRAITGSRYPGVAGIEALAVTAPLFLLMFASAYVVLSQGDAASFSTHQLTRTGSLYFVLTVLSTVGFGDITATSHSARVLVMAQMVLDLVVLGLGIQAYRGAVQVGRRRSRPVAPPRPQDPGPGTGVPEHVEGSQP